MGPKLRRSRWGFVAASLACACAFAACSSFEEDPVGTTPEAGTGDVVGSDAAADALDAGGDSAPNDPDASLGDDATTVLASGLPTLVALAVSDTQEVFVASSNGEIRKIPLIGGDGGATLIATEPNVRALAVTGQRLMYAAAPSKLGRMDFAGSNSADRTDAPITSLVTASPMSAFALKATTTVEVRRYDNDGLNPGEGTTTTAGANDLAFVGDKVFWTDPPAGTVWSWTVGNASATAFQTGEVGCSGVAADFFGVYWLTPSAVIGKPTTGAKKTIANDKAVAIAAEGGQVYWLASAPPGRLRKAAIADDQGPRQTLASGFAVDFKPSQKPIALTPSFVVWITSDGRVLRHDR